MRRDESLKELENYLRWMKILKSEEVKVRVREFPCLEHYANKVLKYPRVQHETLGELVPYSTIDDNENWEDVVFKGVGFYYSVPSRAFVFKDYPRERGCDRAWKWFQTLKRRREI